MPRLAARRSLRLWTRWRPGLRARSAQTLCGTSAQHGIDEQRQHREHSKETDGRHDLALETEPQAEADGEQANQDSDAGLAARRLDENLGVDGGVELRFTVPQEPESRRLDHEAAVAPSGISVASVAAAPVAVDGGPMANTADKDLLSRVVDFQDDEVVADA